jgi:hypothetical protein
MLRALTDGPLTDHEAGHLDGCLPCTAELDTLRRVADAGRHTQGLHLLPRPPARVWQKIQADLAAAGRGIPPAPVGLHTDPPAPAAATRHRTPAYAPRRRRAARRGPGWAMTALVAAAAAAVTAAVTVVVLRPPEPVEQARGCAGVAEVRLEALPEAPAGTIGSACLRTGTGGERRLHISAQGMPDQPGGDYEAWLLDSTSLAGPALRMQALGVLGTGAGQTLTVPAGLDLSRYNIIDISAEPHDGNAAHSGRSLLRGTLG